VLVERTISRILLEKEVRWTGLPYPTSNIWSKRVFSMLCVKNNCIEKLRW